MAGVGPGDDVVIFGRIPDDPFGRRKDFPERDFARLPDVVTPAERFEQEKLDVDSRITNLPSAAGDQGGNYHHIYSAGVFAAPAQNQGGTQFGNGTEKVIPIFIWQTVTIDQLLILVTSAASGDEVVRLGIYSDDTDDTIHYPGALLVDGGTVAMGTTGFKSVSVNQQLTPGLYWLVAKLTFTTGAGGVVRSYVSGSSNQFQILPVDTAATAAITQFVGYSRSGVAAGAFDDPYASSVALSSATAPIIMIQVASVDA